MATRGSLMVELVETRGTSAVPGADGVGTHSGLSVPSEFCAAAPFGDDVPTEEHPFTPICEACYCDAENFVSG